MMKTIVFDPPVKVGDKEIAEITIREPTIADCQFILSQVKAQKQDLVFIEKMINTIARLSNENLTTQEVSQLPIKPIIDFANENNDFFI